MITDPEALRMPPKFCSKACREELLGISDWRLAEQAMRDRDLDSAQRSKRFRRKGRKDPQTAKPHQYVMAMAHSEKLRWGLYPEKLLVQILKLGWKDEREFFTTEDRWPPAVYERLSGVPQDQRQPVAAVNLIIRQYGQTEGSLLPPDPDAPSEASYKARAKELREAFKSEKSAPDYVDLYIRMTGNNPNRR